MTDHEQASIERLTGEVRDLRDDVRSYRDEMRGFVIGDPQKPDGLLPRVERLETASKSWRSALTVSWGVLVAVVGWVWALATGQK